MPAFNDVQIVDFKAIPSKVTYVLSTGNKGYFVQNRDSNQKDFDGNYKERRVTLGRLTHGWNFGSKGIGLQFKGMRYSGPDELFEVDGELLQNKNGYAIVNEVPTDITPTEMTKLFAKPLLQQLEHFMIPEIMANNIRKHKTTSIPSKEQSGQCINYGKIKVENFMKRPDRMIYMLADVSGQIKSWQQPPRFVIMNNDSDMEESWRLDRNWKTVIEHPKTRRHITVARMIEEENERKMNLCAGLRSPTGALFMGFAYPTSLYCDDGGDLISKKIKKEIGKKEFSKRYPELYAGAGRIESSYCYKSESEKNITYTTVNEMTIEEKTSKMAKLLTPALLQQLERFTVPHEMAVQIREHAKS